VIVDRLKPKACPNCLETNKIDSKFCAKCRMVLTYDEYVETLDQQDDIEKIKPSNCRECLKYNVYLELGPRIVSPGEPIPTDHDSWLQCYNCGEIYAVYEKKNEPVIEDFTETFDNSFDVVKDAVIGIDSRKATKKVRKSKELFGDINYPDLKRELASGQTQLISYTEGNLI
jgi:hypothetical protein